MASSIVLPTGVTPTNLHLNPDTDKARMVTADLFGICDRIREISPKLYILELERKSAEGERWGYAVMEHCDDGVDRLVFRVAELDARVLERLRYAMSLSLHDRIALIDREREKWEAEKADAELENLYERMGGQMYIEGARTGFWDRPESYRPLNKTARRHGRRI